MFDWVIIYLTDRRKGLFYGLRRDSHRRALRFRRFFFLRLRRWGPRFRDALNEHFKTLRCASALAGVARQSCKRLFPCLCCLHGLIRWSYRLRRLLSNFLLHRRRKYDLSLGIHCARSITHIRTNPSPVPDCISGNRVSHSFVQKPRPPMLFVVNDKHKLCRVSRRQIVKFKRWSRQKISGFSALYFTRASSISKRQILDSGVSRRILGIHQQIAADPTSDTLRINGKESIVC